MNGRVLDGAEGGVRRYAEAVLARLPCPAEVLRPTRGRGLRGHLWEQARLSRLAPGVLWSPANSGPLGHPRQVVTIHDVAVLDHPEWFAPGFARWYGWLLPRLARRALLVLTNSEFSRRRIALRCCVPPEKIVVTPLASRFPVQTTRPAPVENFADPYVLFVGTLEPRKNLSALLSAWQLSLPCLPQNYRLVLAGGMGPTGVFAAAGLRDLPARVRLLGHVENDDLPGWYANARLVVYPSLYEGFGLPPLEAMACGAPVLASNGGALPEVLGDAACIFDVADHGALGCRLVELLRSPDRLRAMSAAGKAWVKQYSWDRCAAETWAVIKRAQRACRRPASA